MTAHDLASGAERGAYMFAGVAAFSFWQGFALGVTILAGLASLLLAAFRIHDRIKYGPKQ
jgi:tetrahydromethanopterin S-methyltransferase subunit B